MYHWQKYSETRVVIDAIVNMEVRYLAAGTVPSETDAVTGTVLAGSWGPLFYNLIPAAGQVTWLRKLRDDQIPANATRISGSVVSDSNSRDD